jgi:hypothetical protein
MGFFTTRADPDEQRIRAYLAEGHDGPRTDWLASAAVLRIAETPIAAPSRSGTVVALPDLQPATRLVRELMAQDRELSAWITRKMVVQLNSVLQYAMTGDFATDFATAFAEMGLVSEPGAVRFARPHDLPREQADGAKAMADIVICLMTILVTPAAERPRQAGWDVFVNLYTQRTEESESLAYDLIAWMAVMSARLRNTDRFTRPVPYFGAEWRHVPRLTAAGWYPNPGKHGQLVDGVPAFQRRWDGRGWTQQVRMRTGRQWQTADITLFHAPTD